MATFREKTGALAASNLMKERSVRLAIQGTIDTTLTEPGVSYFYWVDFLRGFAALSVLIWHYQHLYSTAPGIVELADKSTQPFYDILWLFYNYGRHAVYLFWVISGFVFSTVYIKKERTTAKDFFIHRFARLYPLHFLTLIVVAVLQALSRSEERR